MAMIAGLLNLALGVVYVAIGVMIAIDLEQAIRRRGWSHFGVSWLTIMFTCGGHHLVHGVHLAGEGRGIGWLDVVAVTLGLPAGSIFSWLRIQSRRGGAGDHLISGTPAWLRTLTGGYGVVAAVVLVSGLTIVVTRGVSADGRLLPNLLLMALYIAVGAVLWRGQARNRSLFGGWSMSGLSLMMIFPTCALMHGVYVVYAASGTFMPDYHGLWIDWLSVASALYFLWVVQGLERGTIADWNERFENIDRPPVPPSATPPIVQDAPAEVLA